MDFFKTTDRGQPIYLHFNNEKFWEIKMDKNSNKTIIRCGRLIDGEEEIFTVKAVEKTYDSRGEAMQAVDRLTKIKFSKGYKNIKEIGSNLSTKSGFSTSENSRSENNIKEELGTKRTAHELVGDIIKKQIKIESTQLIESENSNEEQSFVQIRKTETNKNSVSARIPYSDSENQTLIKDKASELGLKCSVEDMCVVVEGLEGQFEALQTYSELLTNKKEDDSSIKKIPMTMRIKTHIIAVEKKGKELGLVCTVGKDQILVMGSEGKIRMFKEYLADLEEGKGEKANKEEVPNEFIQQEVPLSVNHKSKKPEIEKTLQDLGLFYEFSGDKLFVLGARKTIALLVEFLTNLDPKQKEKEKPLVEEKKQEIVNKVVSDANNNITDGQEIMMRKEIDMENIDDNRLRKIERKGEEEGIIVTVLRGKLAMLGLRTKMGEFLAYIETVKKDSDSGNTVSTKENNSVRTVSNTDDYTQKELNISTFHRARKEELKAKARELDLICDFAYDIVLVSGSTTNIYKFITMLYEVETEAKKSLYPKYWDFHDTRPFSKVEISKKSPEFQFVADKFLESLDEGFQIIRIERIQNRYLMEHYITNIQKKMELRSGKRVKRELLFHGTRNADPEIIYKSFDTGFDTQFAANGSCGTGLYFAVNAAYSCEGYEHRTRQGTFQIFLADVFVGESADAEAGNGKKAPNGADSVFCEEFYVIYNNFHSYPLYLIEYSTEDADGWDGY